MKKPVPAAFKANQFKKVSLSAPPMTAAVAPKKVPLKTAPAGPKAVPFAPPARAFPMDALHASNAEKRSK